MRASPTFGASQTSFRVDRGLPLEALGEAGQHVLGQAQVLVGGDALRLGAGEGEGADLDVLGREGGVLVGFVGRVGVALRLGEGLRRFLFGPDLLVGVGDDGLVVLFVLLFLLLPLVNLDLAGQTKGVRGDAQLPVGRGPARGRPAGQVDEVSVIGRVDALRHGGAAERRALLQADGGLDGLVLDPEQARGGGEEQHEAEHGGDGRHDRRLPEAFQDLQYLIKHGGPSPERAWLRRGLGGPATETEHRRRRSLPSPA